VPGLVVHAGATVVCKHGGQAQPTAPDPRVLVGGRPVSTMASQYMVAGCPFVPPSGNGPCVSALWILGAFRVLASGKPVVLQNSIGLALPTFTLLSVVATQPRVRGS
jgi:hypothetical protein